MSIEMIGQWKTKWNSFNPVKCLVHVPYWRPIIEDHFVPPPLFVSVDPCSACNLACGHCNAKKVMESNTARMSPETVDAIIVQLEKWGTRSVCVGGGGEPLVNGNTYYLIEQLHRVGIETAFVTNGTLLGKNIDPLLKLKYLGISVDAGTTATWQEIKGSRQYYLEDILVNISRLTGRGLDVTYKYLVTPRNCDEVYLACRHAKRVGCDAFHLRPAGAPWFVENPYEFTASQRAFVGAQLDMARQDFEDDKFKIYGVVSKFSDNWQKKVEFQKCWTVFTTCVIDAAGMVSLCCDRRGDASMILGHISEIDELWGDEKHWQIQSKICVERCPRCTFGHVNEVFEAFILEDKTYCNFF